MISCVQSSKYLQNFSGMELQNSMTFRISCVPFKLHPTKTAGDTYAQWCHHDQELCVEGSGMSHGLVEGTGARWVLMLLKMKGRYID